MWVYMFIPPYTIIQNIRVNEDMMVSFDVEPIIENKPHANRLKQSAHKTFFTNR